MRFGRPTVHLCNPLTNAAGGSEWRTISLYRELRDHADVRVWSNGAEDPRVAELIPVSRIRPWRGAFPRSGTLVFVGSYHFPGRWTWCSWPSRIVVIHNTVDADVLCAVVRRLSRHGQRPVEIVYASAALRAISPFHGTVETSLVDAQVFRPAERASAPFTIGRLSRDIPAKHHPLDVDVYRALGGSGARVRLMGATCIADAVGDLPGVEVMPACAEPPDAFLRSLDCFFYRTSDMFFETFGRVVLEAMASGVPVVCARRGGYAEFVDHGKTGFLFDSNAAAIAHLTALRLDPALRARMGKAARARAVDVIDNGRAAVRRFYLGSSSPALAPR